MRRISGGFSACNIYFDLGHTPCSTDMGGLYAEQLQYSTVAGRCACLVAADWHVGEHRATNADALNADEFVESCFASSRSPVMI